MGFCYPQRNNLEADPGRVLLGPVEEPTRRVIGAAGNSNWFSWHGNKKVLGFGVRFDKQKKTIKLYIYGMLESDV